MIKKLVFICSFLFSSVYALNIGEVPKSVVIDGKNGGKTDKSAWSSSSLKGKVHVVFYVDPDEKDTNNAFVDALKAKKFDKSDYGSVAIINLAATWKPNIVIEALLKAKQKKFPDTIYVKDKKKVLVKEWSLADDSSNILVFDKSGKLIYSYAGKLDTAEIEKVLKLIELNL
jgi:YtfJ family uncharacterized protein